MNFNIVNAFLEANGENITTSAEPKIDGVPVKQLDAASEWLGQLNPDDSLDWSTLSNHMLDAMHKALVDASIDVVIDLIGELVPLTEEQQKVFYEMMCIPVQFSGDFWREVIRRHGIIF